jgi:hypothetical protein
MREIKVTFYGKDRLRPRFVRVGLASVRYHLEIPYADPGFVPQFHVIATVYVFHDKAKHYPVPAFL